VCHESDKVEIIIHQFIASLLFGFLNSVGDVVIIIEFTANHNLLMLFQGFRKTSSLKIQKIKLDHIFKGLSFPVFPTVIIFLTKNKPLKHSKSNKWMKKRNKPLKPE
jgi:hypothetical protein